MPSFVASNMMNKAADNVRENSPVLRSGAHSSASTVSGMLGGSVSTLAELEAEPYTEHPEDNDDGHAEDDLGEDEASSLHPSRERAASSLGRPVPSPVTALLMA